MDRETLINTIDEGPIRIYLNDKTSHDIPDQKSATADDTTAYVLYLDQETSQYKTNWIPLSRIVRMERITSATNE